MADNRRNNSSGIILLFLMFVFFSFFQREKDKSASNPPSVIPNTNIYGLQAIQGPTVTTPIVDFNWIHNLNTKFAFLDCISGGQFNFDKLISSYFSSYQHNSLFENPIIGLFFLQKIPEQGKEDEIPSVS
jgi:hypothetical protein